MSACIEFTQNKSAVRTCRKFKDANCYKCSKHLSPDRSRRGEETVTNDYDDMDLEL